MKVWKILFVVAVVGFSGCTFRSFYGIKPTSANSRTQYFASVDSCAPTLSWKADEKLVEEDVMYDLSVHKALVKKGELPERGENVFYQENLTSSSLTMPTPLEPKTRYFWSVRARKKSGDMTAWATYSRIGSTWYGATKTTYSPLTFQ